MLRFPATLLLCLTLFPVAEPATDLARPVASAACDTSDIARALVGSWRGYAVYRHPRSYFYRVDAWFRFTDYGIVEMYRGPLAQEAANNASIRLRGDYEVVGQNVLVSFDNYPPEYMYLLSGFRVTCDELEFVGQPQLNFVDSGPVPGLSLIIGRLDAFVLRRE